MCVDLSQSVLMLLRAESAGQISGDGAVCRTLSVAKNQQVFRETGVGRENMMGSPTRPERYGRLSWYLLETLLYSFLLLT